MNLGVVSLIALALAIFLGFTRKNNVGILAIGFALIIATTYGIKNGDIFKGFSTSLCLTMVGVSYLFAILTENKTLSTFAAKVMALAGNQRMLLYVITYVLGFIICAVGPGAIPSLAVVPVLAIPIAKASGLNPIVLCLAGQMGVQSARMSPLTPEAAVVNTLMTNQGIDGGTFPITYCFLATEILLFLSAFAYFKGWKVDESMATNEAVEVPSFSKEQIISLIVLAGMIVGVLMFKLNVGLTSFLAGSILVLLKIGKDKQAIKAVPWNVIFMVLGVGMLMHIVVISGGIKLLANGMSAFMSAHTADAVMVCFAGVMSFFSSGLGVVFPTLIPTVSQICQNIPGSNAVELVSMVVIGGTVTGFSPISTAGALIMSAVSADEDMAKKYSQNSMFRDLFVVAFMALIISSILGIVGIYSFLLP